MAATSPVTSAYRNISNTDPFVVSQQIRELYQIADRLNTIIPVGAVIPWYGSRNNIPVNYLLCDGASYAISDYMTLSTALGSAAIVSASPTLFSVPNLLGYAIRFILAPPTSDGGQTQTKTSQSGAGFTSLETLAVPIIRAR